MTHSLHRFGESQDRDYVWLLYHVKGINDQNLTERYRRAIELAEQAGAENWGDVKSGPIVCLPPEEIKAKLTEKSRIRGVFTTQGQVTQFLTKMKQADLGLCVIITGPLDRVLESCDEAGLKPHTINYSLGVFGKKDLLPDEEILSITSMCGHHLIPDGVVARMQERVQEGEMTPEEAANKMAAMCPCGIFNPARAVRLLNLRKRKEQGAE